MTSLALLLALGAPAADTPAKPAAAKVTITAELVCQHCTFGIEDRDGCGACLKLDEKTPVLLNGKIADDLLKARFDKKIYVAEGTLSIDKQKRMVLTLSGARERTDADKGKVPEPGQARVIGTVQTTNDTVIIQNGDTPVTVETKAAAPKEGSPPVAAVGKLSVKDGKLRVESTTLQPAPPK
jgi:hypothetical protein